MAYVHCVASFFPFPGNKGNIELIKKMYMYTYIDIYLLKAEMKKKSLERNNVDRIRLREDALIFSLPFNVLELLFEPKSFDMMHLVFSCLYENIMVRPYWLCIQLYIYISYNVGGLYE